MNDNIGQILIKLGVKEKHVQAALNRQKVTKEPLTVIAQDMGLVSGEKIAEATATMMGVNYFHPNEADVLDLVEMEALKGLVEKFDGFVPVGKNPTTGSVTVAISSPEIENHARNVFVDHAPIICVASEQTIQRVYRLFFARTAEAFDEAVAKVCSAKKSVRTQKDSEADLMEDNYVQRMICALLRHACYTGASDIYLWQTKHAGNIKLKIDGTGQIFRTLPIDVFHRVVNTLVLQSGKAEELKHEPVETRIDEPPSPQMGEEFSDVFGRYVFRNELVQDSVTGFINAVIRVNDSQATEVDFEGLGFDPEVEILLRKWGGAPNGLILVTGPTGSGKTTTLYSLMREIDPIDRAVFSIEKPVEYRHGSWIQHELPKKLDEGTAARVMLKALLREAPDVILIGELRDDPELIKTALAAANTGHLVFATLHTNGAAHAVMRLTEIGAPHEALAAVLKGSLAQRLVGKLCPDCKKPDDRPETFEELKHQSLVGKEITPYREAGCEHCGFTGFRGRRMVYEVMDGSKVRHIIESKGHVSQLEEAGIAEGQSLWSRGLALVAEGITSIDELSRRADRV